MSDPSVLTTLARPKRLAKYILVVFVFFVFMGFLLWPVLLDRVHPHDHSRMISMNNLKQIGLGLVNHDSAKGWYPANAIYSKDGSPLLSWRVAILPFVDEDALYARFKLDEPWDGPTNKVLIANMPQFYANPKQDRTNGLTPYRAFVGQNTAFATEPGEEGVPENRWTFDRLGKAPRAELGNALVIESDDPVIWTKPEDIPFDPTQPLPEFKPIYVGGFMVLKSDGAVISIRRKDIETKLRNSIDPNSTSKEPLGD